MPETNFGMIGANAMEANTMKNRNSNLLNSD